MSQCGSTGVRYTYEPLRLNGAYARRQWPLIYTISATKVLRTYSSANVLNAAMSTAILQGIRIMVYGGAAYVAAAGRHARPPGCARTPAAAHTSVAITHMHARRPLATKMLDTDYAYVLACICVRVMAYVFGELISVGAWLCAG